ncbi:hypothetical protein Q4534_04240 [Cyclobacterium sp. 1_MG-2023]|uniref:hypothetical protein n=1 Tax=Cyclobacterium sp. 1_MG-2023 TaxID=3062681 RepID=UPI0026E1AD6B|nr:hypothetical protein [Cyclobacterium sp. 1_MG-2023]MDO6436599.1 hypothetical protein [Cyclobacterium sp. 1_MG-2023]
MKIAHKMKRCIPLVFLIFLLSCNLDINKDLQIDQSFEGEEAYWVSKILDEHIYLSFYDFAVYSNTEFTDSLPGCPTISIDNEQYSVTIDYDNPSCEDGSTDRQGKLQFQYSSVNNNVNTTIKITYDGYQTSSNTIEGYRLFQVTNKTTSELVLQESSDSLLLKDENESSTSLALNLEHAGKIQNNVLTEIKSSGALTGRNWGGNQIEAVILKPKVISQTCLTQVDFYTVSGEENWTIKRSENSQVTHQLTYSNTEGCETTTTIKLDEGVTMVKQP